MTVNPYTLNSLYNQGIIECVPYELCMGTPVTQSGVMETMGMSAAPQMGSLKQTMLGNESIVNQQYNNFNQQYSEFNSQTMNGSQYLDMAKKGEMYGYYGNYNDSFVRTTNPNNQPIGTTKISRKMSDIDNGVGREYNFANAAYGRQNGVGTDIDYERMANDSDGQNLRVSIQNAASSAKEGVMNSHPIVKGLLSVGIIAGTIALIVKGKKKPAVPTQTGTSFWSKLNPKNWFKKN